MCRLESPMNYYCVLKCSWWLFQPSKFFRLIKGNEHFLRKYDFAIDSKAALDFILDVNERKKNV